MNKLIINGSVLENYEVIKNFVEQNVLSPDELYLQSNLPQSMVEAFFCVYNALLDNDLINSFTFYKVNENVTPVISYPESNIC